MVCPGEKEESFTVKFQRNDPRYFLIQLPFPIVTFGGLLLSRDRSLGSLSKDVFERRTSTGSEAFSLFICLDANKLVLLSFFSLLKTIYPRVSTKTLPNDAESPLPVDVRRSTTLLLKLPTLVPRARRFLVTWSCYRLSRVALGTRMEVSTFA